MAPYIKSQATDISRSLPTAILSTFRLIIGILYA